MPSNLPIRRLGMGGSNLPVRRLGLGEAAWLQTAVALSPAQVDAFLSRHDDIKRKVDVFESQVANGGYRQGVSKYAIPAWGITVADSVHGNVLIFAYPDGTLHFSGGIPSDIAEGVDLPNWFQSPPPEDSDPLTLMLKAVPWVVGGIIGLTLLNTVRGR